MSVGGNGTEMKTWQEVKEMREKAARNGKRAETHSLELIFLAFETSLSCFISSCMLQ